MFWVKTCTNSRRLAKVKNETFEQLPRRAALAFRWKYNYSKDPSYKISFDSRRWPIIYIASINDHWLRGLESPALWHDAANIPRNTKHCTILVEWDSITNIPQPSQETILSDLKSHLQTSFRQSCSMSQLKALHKNPGTRIKSRIYIFVYVYFKRLCVMILAV